MAAEEEGSKPKYEVEEISIKTRVQKILDLSTSRWVGLNSPEYDFENNTSKTDVAPSVL